MLPMISSAEAAKRSPDDGNYIVDFYWRGNPVLERIQAGIKQNTCGALRSLRFTWCRPKNEASSEEIFIEHTLAAMLDGSRRLADSPISMLHIEKVPKNNILFALVQFANGVVAELELNECLPLSMQDTCFIKANFTNGHITNQPLVGYFNEEGAILASDDSSRMLICETDDIKPAGSVIEQMQQRFRILAERGEIQHGDQGAGEIMKLINQAIVTTKR